MEKGVKYIVPLSNAPGIAAIISSLAADELEMAWAEIHELKVSLDLWYGESLEDR